MANRCPQPASTSLTWTTGPIISGPNILLWLVSFLLLCPQALADSHNNDSTTWIPFKATYVAVINGTTVDDNGVRRLEYLGDKHFRFTAVAENLLFKFEEVTEFQAQGAEVYPLQYQSTRSNPFKTRKKAIGFDWNKNQAHYRYKDKQGTLKLESRVVDPLTSVFELARQLKMGKTHIVYHEVGSRKVKERVFQVLGEETIELPYGKTQTVKLQKMDDDDKKTIVWLAPHLNHLAVKVQQNDEGEEYVLALKSYKPGKAVNIKQPAPPPQNNSSQKPAPVTELPVTAADIK